MAGKIAFLPEEVLPAPKGEPDSTKEDQTIATYTFEQKDQGNGYSTVPNTKIYKY